MIPAIRLELMVGLGAVGGDYMTLDDPVKGELDEALYPLYDPTGSLELFENVAEYGYAYSYRRGRATEFDDVTAGSLAVDFRNHTGALLPAALGGDESVFGVGAIILGRRVRLYLDHASVFDGVIEDWDYTFPIGGGASASFVALDPLGAIAQKELSAHTGTLEYPGTRIGAVLDRAEVGFPSGQRALQVGDVTLLADIVPDGTNALAYIQKVARSGGGVFYAAPSGVVTFRAREDVTYTLALEFSDDGTGVPFSRVTPTYGADRLINRVSVTRVGGAVQTAEDATSRGAYGARSKSYSGMLMAADGDAYTLASRELTRHSSPNLGISSLGVNLGALTATQRVNVLNLDVGDSVRVTWTPEGAASQSVNTYWIEGISGSGSYNSLGSVSFTLSPATFVADPFVLDSATAGRLNTDAL